MFEYSKHDFIETTELRNKESLKMSRFDSTLLSKWDDAMDSGRFRYNWDNIQQRLIKGDHCYVAELNVKRFNERRKPQTALSVKQPFNPDLFNFTKIKKEEVLFCLRNIEDCSDSLASVDKRTDKPHMVFEGNMVIINVSPLGYGSVLIVPDIQDYKPQRLTESGIKLALEVMLLSAHRGFRMCFNSVCGMASVNHQHLHGYYLDRELMVENCKVKSLCGECYETIDLPVPGFVFQLYGNPLLKLVRLIHAVTDYFCEKEIAHNLFLTRGKIMDDSEDRNTIRVFVWPRKSELGDSTSGAFNIAGLELAGHIPFKVSDEFDGLKASDIETRLCEARLSEGEYNLIRKDLTNLIENIRD